MAKVKKISLVNYSAEDILRRHWNRSKKARMIDRKKQASTKSGGFEKGEKWVRDKLSTKKLIDIVKKTSHATHTNIISDEHANH